MRLSRRFALLIGLATAAFTAFVWVRQELGTLSLILLATSACLMLFGGLGRSSRKLDRQVIAVVSVVYTFALLAALLLQFDREMPLSVRTGLAGFLMLGALLSLRCLHQVNRNARYGFQNYYDPPARR